jgi:cytochrome c
MASIANWPMPQDIPLPLPAGPVLLQTLLVVAFMWHIIFVNLMVGGSLLTVVFQLIGLRRPDYDVLARAIAGTVTVNKSLAVVLGVAPLLVINVFYTVYFYTANALTGSAWLAVVPLVTMAFLLTYAHKYSWDRLAQARGLHIALGMAGAGLFLFIPLIFLTNINLMLFPGRWFQVEGFLSALMLPNVWPRYFHFLAASVAISSLFFLFFFLRKDCPIESKLQDIDRGGLRRLFYGLALGSTSLQLIFGPWVLFTLPGHGMSWHLIGIISVGVVFALWAMLLMWREIIAPRPRLMSRAVMVFILITLTAFTMGYGRHVYRESAISEHRALMAAHTEDTGWLAAAAQWREATGQQRVRTPLGQRVFESTCAACHALDRTLVGPSIIEIAREYPDHPDGIAAWTREPGRKRMDMPPMPAFRLGDETLQAVAQYILRRASDEPFADEG